MQRRSSEVPSHDASQQRSWKCTYSANAPYPFKLCCAVIKSGLLSKRVSVSCRRQAPSFIVRLKRYTVTVLTVPFPDEHYRLLLIEQTFIDFTGRASPYVLRCMSIALYISGLLPTLDPDFSTKDRLPAILSQSTLLRNILSSSVPTPFSFLRRIPRGLAIKSRNNQAEANSNTRVYWQRIQTPL